MLTIVCEREGERKGNEGIGTSFITSNRIEFNRNEHETKTNPIEMEMEIRIMKANAVQQQPPLPPPLSHSLSLCGHTPRDTIKWPGTEQGSSDSLSPSPAASRVLSVLPLLLLLLLHSLFPLLPLHPAASPPPPSNVAPSDSVRRKDADNGEIGECVEAGAGGGRGVPPG